MGFEDLVSKMNEKNQFKKVCVDQGVIDSVVFYSKKSYPNEFLAMLILMPETFLETTISMLLFTSLLNIHTNKNTRLKLSNNTYCRSHDLLSIKDIDNNNKINIPFSYLAEKESPSIFGSTTYSAFENTSFTLLLKSRTSL